MNIGGIFAHKGVNMPFRFFDFRYLENIVTLYRFRKSSESLLIQHKSAMDEIFPLVDEQGNVIGKATRSECHGGTFWLHPVVHLHIFNSKGDLFLQKRAMSKDTQPGKWDTAVGGHVDYGEEVDVALRREAFEELGVTEFTSTFVERYVWQSAVEKELVNAYQTVYNGPFKLDYHELDEGRFWSLDEIRSSLGKGVFTPNFEHDFMLVMKSLHK